MHVCTNDGCALAVEHHDRSGTGFSYCPISGIEMRERACVAPTVIKINERYHKAGTVMGKQQRRRRPSSSSGSASPCCVVSSHSVMVLMLSISRSFPRPPPDVAKRLVKNSIKNVGKFLESMFQQCGLSTFPPPPPESFCTAVAKYCTRTLPILSQKHGGKKPTSSILVAVVASLLKSGMTCKGVTIFPTDPWASAHCPPLVSYSQVAGLQCRAMSNCTRLLKEHIFDARTRAINPIFVFATP